MSSSSAQAWPVSPRLLPWQKPDTRLASLNNTRSQAASPPRMKKRATAGTWARCSSRVLAPTSRSVPSCLSWACWIKSGSRSMTAATSSPISRSTSPRRLPASAGASITSKVSSQEMPPGWSATGKITCASRAYGLDLYAPPRSGF